MGKFKPRLFLLFLLIIILLAGGWLLARGASRTRMEQAGALLTQARPQTVVAAWNGNTITAGDVQYQLALDALADPAIQDGEADAQAVLDGLLTDAMVQAEAERLGIAASDEEAAAFLAYQKQMYDSYPELAQSVDDYCRGAGITLEQYWTLYEQLAGTILTKQLYRNWYYEQFTAQNGADAVQEGEAREQAYQAHLQQLFAEHQSEITYYPLS